MSTRAKILVVDDDQRLLDSQQELIAIHGYEVDGALGGASGIEQLRRQHYDILVLDLMMPDISGHEVMEFVDASGIDTTVIVVSGASSIDEAIKSLRRGAYSFLRKPYEPEELLTTIDNALKKRHLEQENRTMQVRLQHSEKLHRFIVNSSPDIVYILDQQGRFTFLNDRIEFLLGYGKKDLIGRHYSEIVYGDDQELARYLFNERRTGERASRNVEIRLKCKDDACRPRHFETNFLPIELSAMGVYSHKASDDKHFVGTYGVARDITERKKAEEIIHYQAYHDLLTGLPNRSLFKDRLNMAVAQARRSKQPLVVMFLDLNRFKFVNDTLGHVAGDELLRAVSRRLKVCLREGDTLARIGGDEFTLLLPQVSSREDAATIARKIIAELNQPFVLDVNELFLSVSIGIAVFPEDGHTMDTLVKNADIAMYHIKGKSKGGYQFYSDYMDVNYSQHLSLERDMRKALEANQFLVFYQPQLDVVSGEIVGMEALIRWHHPSRGLLSPTEFIPLAEETGLIMPMGKWILRTVCRQVKQWRESGLPPVRMAVNLSGLQVEQERIVETVISALEENRLPGNSLELEITENVIMKDLESVVEKLRKLSSHGVNIAIDDFGTGYSSLSYLQKLPIHTIKIDRSFVHDIKAGSNESSIIAAIIAMAKGMRLNLIAEGVETKYQLDYLRALGCAGMQGFYFSPPLDHEAATKLLATKPFTSSALPS